MLKGLPVWRKVFGCLFPFLKGFPPPVLEIEELYPLAGTDINVTCAGHVLTSPSPTLRLQGARGLPAPGEPAWLLLTTREEDDGRNFSCEASLEVQGQQLIKTTTVQLHVLCKYQPHLLKARSITVPFPEILASGFFIILVKIKKSKEKIKLKLSMLTLPPAK